MSDDQRTTQPPRPDPAETSPAEGASHEIPSDDQGKGQGADTAANSDPAEGARDD